MRRALLSGGAVLLLGLLLASMSPGCYRVELTYPEKAPPHTPRSPR